MKRQNETKPLIQIGRGILMDRFSKAEMKAEIEKKFDATVFGRAGTGFG